MPGAAPADGRTAIRWRLLRVLGGVAVEAVDPLAEEAGERLASSHSSRQLDR